MDQDVREDLTWLNSIV